MTIDPRRVLTFREVARLGSFSRAAEALALTQPAVSQQVGRLELATSQLAELTDHVARELHVGAFPSALATRVPQALARLTEARPGVKANVAEGTIDALVDWVRSGAVHAAICFQDAAAERREHEGTQRIDLGEEPFCALLPPAHRLAGEGPIRLRDLAEETWVAPSRRGLIVRACDDAGFTPAIRYVSRDPLANRGLVASGLAVTISPAELAAEFTGIAVEPLADAPTRTVYALLPAAGATPLARAF